MEPICIVGAEEQGGSDGMTGQAGRARPHKLDNALCCVGTRWTDISPRCESRVITGLSHISFGMPMNCSIIISLPNTVPTNLHGICP